ncbi:MAG: STM3941 family protein [Spirulina sp.]
MEIVNQKQEKLVIYPNKKRIAIAALFTSLATLFFFWLIGASLDHADPRFLDYILGILLGCYFAYLSFDRWTYLLKNQNKPALIIDEKGIFDNTLFSQTGAVAWQNIEEIFLYDLQLKSGGRERAFGIVPKAGKTFLKQFPLSWRMRRIAIATFFRFPITRAPINILLRDLNLQESWKLEQEIHARRPKL